MKKCLKENELKIANITPQFKKQDPLDKKNGKTIGILPTVLKAFGRMWFNKLQSFSNKLILPLHCGFRKGYNTHYTPINHL